MTGVRRSLTYRKPDSAVEALSAESQSIQEGGPPDRVEKTPSVGDTRKDEEADESGEAESDSGDSLFITQKQVPGAVRSVERRRRHNRLSSDPSSPRDQDESADDISSSDSLEEAEAKPKRPVRKTAKLPKFNFPFLRVTGRKSTARRGFLTSGQNITLHTHVMGGFFINVRELLEDHQQRDGSLPTVDKEGEDISPLSEEEEGGSESEDMKVVERKRFVGRSKCSQPWCVKSSNGSQLGQKKRIDKAPAKASTSRLPALSSDTGLETETRNKHPTSDGNTVAQTETLRTSGQFTNGDKNIVLQEKENEKELCEDSDATVCEALELGNPQAQEHPEDDTLNGRDASPLRTEPQADVFHTDNLLQTGQEEDIPDSQTLLQSLPDLIIGFNYNGLHSEPRLKEKRKKAKGVDESVEGEKDQSREEPKGQHTAVSVSLETEEIPSLSEDNPVEPPAPQTSAEPKPNEENSSHDEIALREGEKHSPDSKQIKQKRKKRSAADSGGQEQDGNVETDVRLESDSLLPEIRDVVVQEEERKKKKKRERNAEGEEGIEQLQLSTVAEAANDDVETQGKKKKRKKEKMLLNINTEELEEAEEASRERLENEKKRKKKKKQMSDSHHDVQVGGEDGADLGSPNDVTLEESTEQSMKKKKKKNKKKESIPEEEDISGTPDKSKMVNSAGDSQTTEEGPSDQDAEVVSKEKKKKKKKSEIFSGNEDALTQSDDSVSVRKKKKKRTSSFLIADAEEKDAQTQDKQSSTSVAAHVWDAQKPGVSAGDVETESAKIAGNVEAANDGSRKKKRKRGGMSVAQESAEQDHEQDFKKPKEIYLSCLPETTDTGVKKKKKRKRSGSESVTSTETFISSSEAGYPTDEAVTLKKKKKKKKETQQSPAAATDDAESEEAVQRSWSSRSHDGKDKQSIFTPPSPVAKDVKEKKIKKKVKSTDDVLLESEPLTECAKIKTHTTEKRDRNKLTSTPSVRSSSKEDVSDCVSKNKSKTAKKKLYNQNVDFLSDG